MRKLSKKIGDPRILELISKFLKAGYKTKSGNIIKSESGTPQGGILSPILANIVLNDFDHYMEERISKFEKGVNRKRNPIYQKLQREMLKLPVKDRTPLRLKLRTTPHGLPYDPNFKRMRFIRYADDFVVLIQGSQDDAIYHRNLIKSYLLQNCGLSLNPLP